MICQELKQFVDHALDTGRLTSDDIGMLRSVVLPNGIQRRAEADALTALDRLVADKHAAWDDAFIDLVVPFVAADAVATRASGRDTVNWLMTTLDAAGAMTDNGLRIAIEVTRAASHIDQTLISFVLQTMQSRRAPVQGDANARPSPCPRQAATPVVISSDQARMPCDPAAPGRTEHDSSSAIVHIASGQRAA